MKPVYTLIPLLALNTLAAAQEPAPSIDVAPVKVTQRIVYNSDEPISYDERQKALALRNVCRILEGVTDLESANAAADAVYENMLVVNVGGEDHRVPDEEITGQQAMDYWMAAKEAGDRMRRVFFYGSEDLAVCMGLEPELAIVPTDAQMQGAREMLSAMREAVVVLSQVIDDRSAAAAVEPFMKLRWRITPAQAAMEGADAASLLYAAGMEEGEMMYLPMISERLKSCNFYGCAELAVALGFSAEDAVMPGKLTPEVQKQLEEALAASLKAVALSGGPGLSPDTAWVLPAGVNVADHLPACMKPDGPAITAPDKPSMLPIMAEPDSKPYKLELWFITKP